MKLALGIVFIWAGMLGIYVASHGTQTTKISDVYKYVMDGIRGA